jgi:glycosyltransferase involved in cell wall biosynthesis
VKEPVSFIVPTRNEERNIREALVSIREWAGEIFVLDSFSDDRTVDIAREMGALVAQRRFDNFSAQKNWALDTLPLKHEWVFFLDADERVPSDLTAEIVGLMRPPGPRLDGYFVGMKQNFLGGVMSHGGWYPNLRLLFFKHRLGRYEARTVHEHLVLNGSVGRLQHELLHHDNKGLHQYFERHNVYSTMEALEAYRHLVQGAHDAATRQIDMRNQLRACVFTAGPERRRALKQWAYRYLPCRPLFKFVWSFVLKQGFRDGRVGFRYCLLQSFYEYQVSLKLRELYSDPDSPMRRWALPPASPK